jgi:methyl-accepting chemotaxis protein
VLERPGDGLPRAQGRPGARHADEGGSLQGRLDTMRATTEAVYKVIDVLGRVTTVQEAARAALDTLRETFGWLYGSFWTLDPEERVLKFAVDSGSINEEFRRATLQARFHEGEGLPGRAWKSRDLFFQPDLEREQEFLRAREARRAGVRSGVAFPILDGGQVVGTMDFFTTETLDPFDERLEALRNVGRLVSNTLYVLRVAEDAALATADSQAVNLVIERVGRAGTAEEAARAALDTLRETFGWLHGTFWRLDPEENVLKFAVDSGSINEEFRRATLQARFREGEGLPGRAWQTRDLLFEPDLGNSRQFLRASVARQTGVKSGVFFPVLDEEETLHGTIELLTTETRALSQRRLSALRNVGRLVSAAIGRISKLAELVDAEQRQRAMTAQLREILALVDQTSRTIAGSSGQLSSASQRMGGVADQTLAQANAASAVAEQVSANAQTVAAGVEEMGVSIKEIAANASEAAKVASTAVAAADTTNSTVARLGESSAEIGKIIKVITTIAGQTNLLALNATIEAARAGEAGKGFAVVANEVKELAKETARASEDIGRKIGAIQRDTAEAVQAIDQIGAVIKQINEIQRAIAGAVEEHTATTGEIAETLTEAAQGSKEIAQNISAVARAASQTTEGVAEIQQASSALARLSSELHTLVGRSGLDAANAPAHARGSPGHDRPAVPPSPENHAAPGRR